MTENTDITHAAVILKSGGLVATPTETVYGLAADATNDEAVARIFEAKGRPRLNPLIAHVPNLTTAEEHVVVSPLARILAESLWPGPLTMVLPRRASSHLSLLVSAGLDTVAVRAPAHPMAQTLLKAVQTPLAAPSANPSGMVSPTTADHVREGLGDKVDYILDGGSCTVGVESTILQVDGGDVQLLRAGGVARSAIEKIIGAPLHDHAHTDKLLAPGMMKSHYAPSAPLRLNATQPADNEAWLGFGPGPDNAAHAINLSETGDLREAAGNLFAHMRALDVLCRRENLSGIAVAPVPNNGLGEAINDRLARAAAPRDTPFSPTDQTSP